MGLLLKIIIILGLIYLITNLFTHSKAERVARRNRTTNMLLLAIVILLALSIASNFYSRFHL